MKSAPKGIEMKLIKILALATAMATMATAQNPGASSQSKASPTPTPVVAGKAGTPQPAKKTPANAQSAAKGTAGAPAKATDSKAAATKSGPAAKTGTTTPAATTTAAATKGAVAKGGATPGALKPAVKTSTAPVKGKAPAGTSANGAPTPVVAAKAADSKKTDTKKADDSKKANAPKAPAVIAVKPKPVQGTKNAVPTQAKGPSKPPVKAPAAQVTQVGPSTKPAEKPKPAARSFGAHGRRDPFVSPIVSKEGVNRPTPNCTSGKRCLVIPELVLQGTVKDTSGKMMAVVANSTRRTYFLRENDQVFQGSVEKITSDSIIFREYIKDALGRETAREVVKKLVPTT
jgi:Tfp pilus assembly protein PilP